MTEQASTKKNPALESAAETHSTVFVARVIQLGINSLSRMVELEGKKYKVTLEPVLEVGKPAGAAPAAPAPSATDSTPAEPPKSGESDAPGSAPVGDAAPAVSQAPAAPAAETASS